MDCCYLCDISGWELRICDTCKRSVCKACARVWYEWRYAQRVTTVAECRPCCNAGLLRAAEEGHALAGDVTMAPAFRPTASIVIAGSDPLAVAFN
jgi:hypothetical protein